MTAVAVLAWAAEALAIALWLAGHSWWPLALAAHTAAAGLAGRGAAEPRGDARFLVVALVLALPAFGLVGLTAIQAWRRRLAPSGLYAGAHSEMAGLPGPGQPDRGNKQRGASPETGE